MDHYLDIDLRPDPEFPAYQLMSALYSKLHRALAGLGSEHLGVSFPRFDEAAPHLGDRLRLHGSANDLAGLMEVPWLTGMRDHVHVGTPGPVPGRTLHRVVRRVQAASSPERLRRRLIRRHQLNEAEARRRIPDSVAERLRLPFVQLLSSSTGQSFRLFVAHEAIREEPVAGRFNAYGLSQGATVPWF